MNNGYETLVPVSDRPAKSAEWRKLFNRQIARGSSVEVAAITADRFAVWNDGPVTS